MPTWGIRRVPNAHRRKSAGSITPTDTGPDLPRIPARVLTAGFETTKMARTNREAWQATAQRAAVPYTKISASGHLMLIDSPDIVVSAILDVLTLVQAQESENQTARASERSRQ